MRYVLILCACLFGAGISATTAQNTQTSTVVPIGDVDYELDLNDPVQACVYEASQTLDGDTVSYRLFVIEDGVTYTVGSYRTDAAGAFESVEVGDCIGMVP